MIFYEEETNALNNSIIWTQMYFDLSVQFLEKLILSF
jgi:hypothetical protein